ncbi:hypothetical protein KI387_011782, partial [Taxus chinensis]
MADAGPVLATLPFSTRPRTQYRFLGSSGLPAARRPPKNILSYGLSHMYQPILREC